MDLKKKKKKLTSTTDTLGMSRRTGQPRYSLPTVRSATNAMSNVIIATISGITRPTAGLKEATGKVSARPGETTEAGTTVVETTEPIRAIIAAATTTEAPIAAMITATTTSRQPILLTLKHGPPSKRLKTTPRHHSRHRLLLVHRGPHRTGAHVGVEVYNSGAARHMSPFLHCFTNFYSISACTITQLTQDHITTQEHSIFAGTVKSPTKSR